MYYDIWILRKGGKETWKEMVESIENQWVGYYLKWVLEKVVKQIIISFNVAATGVKQ
jgi:hypothetical protein